MPLLAAVIRGRLQESRRSEMQCQYLIQLRKVKEILLNIINVVRRRVVPPISLSGRNTPVFLFSSLRVSRRDVGTLSMFNRL